MPRILGGGGNLPPPFAVAALARRVVAALETGTAGGDAVPELAAVIEAWPSDEPSEMQHWVSALNALDQCLEAVLSRGSISCVFLSVATPLALAQVEENGAQAEADRNLIKAVLRVTRVLLENTINKNIYNSTLHLLRLLAAYDDEIAFLALEALVALALPPNSCRCLVENITRHSTQIHKHSSFAVPFFEIIECACAVLPSLPIQDVVEESLQLEQGDADSISLDVTALAAIKAGCGPASPLLPSPREVGSSSSSGGGVGSSSSSSSSDNSGSNEAGKAVISGVQAANLRDLVAQAQDSSQVGEGYLFALVWMARMKKMLYSAAGRVAVISSLYQSVAVLLCCHPDPTVLASFFLDKSNLLRDFVYLVRSGPGSNEYRPAQVPFSLRLLSCACLRAIVGSREAGVSILGRFSGAAHASLVPYAFIFASSFSHRPLLSLFLLKCVQA